MKRAICFVIVFALFLTLCSGCGDNQASEISESSLPAVSEAEPSSTPASLSEPSIALVTSYTDITDQSLNQAVYEACQKYCSKFKLSFNDYKPVADTDESRLLAVDSAVSDGYHVIIMPGAACAGAINSAAEKYPDIKFIALDISAEELNSNGNIPSNVYCAVFRGELCGYMAGYAAVKLGNTQLGFLGGNDSQAVKRYGYGFIQGANEAAREMNETDVSINYYINSSDQYDDDAMTELISSWYTDGTDVVFSAGGIASTSAAEAANSFRGQIIGSEADQSVYFSSDYKKCTVITSAEKDFYAGITHIIACIENNTFPGGTEDLYGLISDTPKKNYVRLSENTEFDTDDFSEDVYDQLVSYIRSGALPVAFDPSASPKSYASSVTVNIQSTISE